MAPATCGVDGVVVPVLAGAVFKTWLARWQELWVWWTGEASAVGAPLAAMMLNRACFVAALANDKLNDRCRGWHHNCLRGRQFIKTTDATALQAVLVEMGQQGVKALVLGKYDAQGVRCRLKGSPELEGNVEVQGVLTSAFNLLEINTGEPVSRGWLLCCLRRVLVGSHIDDGSVAVIQS